MNNSPGLFAPREFSLDLSIVVPIYNEERNLLLLHQRINEALATTTYRYEVIYVNDGSRDQSKTILKTLAATDQRILVINFKKNFGQTAAMMAGFDHAQGEVIVPLDGDLQNDPRDIVLLIEQLNKGFDVCSGWRKDRKDSKLSRNLPSRLANRLISTISGVHLHDYGCSLKAYRRHIIKGVKLYGEMHRFIPIYASWQGARVTEIPVRHHKRQFGHSKYGLERVVKVLLDLLVVKFLAKYAQKPIYPFGAMGLLSICLSFGFALWALGLRVLAEISLSRTPLPLMAVMLFLSGFILLTLGLVAEILMRTYYESQQKPIYELEAPELIFNRTPTLTVVP